MRLLRNVIALTLVVFVSVFLIEAQAGQENAIPQAGEISATDFYILPDTYSYITHIDDSVLERYGCHYRSLNYDVARRLHHLITSFLHEDVGTDEILPKVEIRNKVIFHRPQQPDLVLWYGKKFTDQPFLIGSWMGKPVKLRPELSNKVLEVIAQEKLNQTNVRAPQFCGI